MGSGCHRAQLRGWSSNHSHCPREDARSYEEETFGATKRRTTTRRAGTTVLHVIARIHVEVCQAIHSNGREVYRWLLRHYASAHKTDLRFSACGITKSPAIRFQRRRNSSS